MIVKLQATRVFSKYNGDIIVVINVNAIITEMNTKVASIKVSLSSRRTRNVIEVCKTFLMLKILVLLHDDITGF